MDEEKRDRRIDYTEDERMLDQDPLDEQRRDPRGDYEEDLEALPEDHMQEGLRKREPAFMEAEEEYRARDVNALEDEEIQEREAVLMENEEEFRDTEPAARPAREEARPAKVSTMEKDFVPLLQKSEAEEFRSRWQDIQTDFIDDPRHSVENADELVARVINSITENFARERTSLEEQWNQGQEASTEDLRIAIKRYRSFFNRLLALESTATEEPR